MCENLAKLAWKWLKNCANLLEKLKNLINSADFQARNKLSPRSFTRNRLLPFTTMIFFMINLVKGSIQSELDHLFKSIFKADVCVTIVSKSAFCKARKKLKSEAFIEMNSCLSRFFYNYFPIKTWFGFTLKAWDGSTARVPQTEEVAEHFGVQESQRGKSRPLARVSQMFDVLNKITVDAIIAPLSSGERELAIIHAFNLTPTDLLLMDRGYPAFWLFKLILSVGANFCARISYKKWSVVKKFYYSGAREKIITLKPSYEARKKCRELGLDANSMILRLIRIDLPNGETEILITSLIDTDLYPFDIFGELYHLRWPVEEDYKVMKKRVEVENWTGKSVLSVYQDFHAKVFTKNLTAVLVHPAQQVVEEKTEHRVYKYQINFAEALSKMKDAVVLLFQRSNFMEIISYLQRVFMSCIEPIRPGREYPRKKQFNQRQFYPCYKTTR